MKTKTGRHGANRKKTYSATGIQGGTRNTGYGYPVHVGFYRQTNKLCVQKEIKEKQAKNTTYCNT